MVEQIRRLLAARPFIAFTIRSRDGKSWHIPSPDRVAVSPSGSACFVATDRGAEECPAGSISSVTPQPGRQPQVPVSEVRLLIFDFDGVWSNNQVLVLQDGTEGVLCNRSDGLGLELLRHRGLPMMVVSKEANPVVAARCRKVKIECRQGIDDKLAELNRISAERQIPLRNMAYVGNDVNDVPCMEAVGLSIAVADAYPEAMAVASVVTSRRGGDGAVREVCQWFLSSQAS